LTPSNVSFGGNTNCPRVFSFNPATLVGRTAVQMEKKRKRQVGGPGFYLVRLICPKMTKNINRSA